MTDRHSPSSIVTVGTFDGLHRGHIELLNALLRHACHNGLRPLAITFDRHPLSIVAPERAPLAICTLEEKVRAITEMGIDVEVVTFDRTLCALTAEEWMERTVTDYGARMMMVGYDNTFGRDGVGMTLEDYSRLGEKHGIRVVTAPVLPGVSSSSIRKAVAEGDVETAAEKLGHPFRLKGLVASGDRLGRTMGFPTANLEIPQGLVIPAGGVYAASALVGDESVYPAVVNIGVRPTVTDSRQLRVEAHLSGFDGDLYGKTLSLDFLKRLRNEKKFESLTQLADAIRTDKAAAEKICGCSASDE